MTLQLLHRIHDIQQFREFHVDNTVTLGTNKMLMVMEQCFITFDLVDKLYFAELPLMGQSRQIAVNSSKTDFRHQFFHSFIDFLGCRMVSGSLNPLINRLFLRGFIGHEAKVSEKYNQ